MNRREEPRFAVIGAGNGGCAMAAHLALMGFDVNLYNRSEKRIKPIRARGGIQLEGVEKGFARLNLVTIDIEKAIRNTDVIMVTTPATAHRAIAHNIAPHLEEGQIVVLNPGRTGGALEFRNILKTHGINKDVIIAEAQTFIYACRVIGPARAKIYGIKNVVAVAAIPAYKTMKVVEKLNVAYPQFIPASNVLETSFNNIGAIFHPAPTILNSARIETTKGDFQYYIEGISPSVTKVIEKMDEERVRVAKALGAKAITAMEWLKYTYDAEGSNLYEAIQNAKGYKGLKAPDNIYTRYIFEDVPESLVPISSIGKMVGVETPIINSVIQMACAMHDVDYWKEGRTAEKLGLVNMSPEMIYQLVTEGDVYEEGFTDEEALEGSVA